MAKVTNALLKFSFINISINPKINMADLILWTRKYFIEDSDDKIIFEIMRGINDTRTISNPHQIIIQLLVLIHIITPTIINAKKNIFDELNFIIKKKTLLL